MIIHIPEVLNSEELSYVRSVFAKATFVDGKVTAGEQSMQVKKNVQIDQSAPESKELGEIVLKALGRNPIFNSAVMPYRVVPPLFNRYDTGMEFPDHVDNALRPILGTNMRIRTDVSSTLFLNDPTEYEGGELIIHDHSGSQAIKLPAGDMIVYPTYNLHSVSKITKGSRWASFFWTQSMIKEADKRKVLFDLDMTIIKLRTRMNDNDPQILELTNVYHNLMRLWCDL
ncbi:Fe2+-dependent dioxygenase [Commensalibacter nepenthis]|uniref:Fe2+-dependent dioxygenase n=1 Tax=Commensalibacter nepenthis TaxID=3043872 RepID=A0ABT6QA78_9PROT|nr:Fe2+-dependent dioxygenase [Commensalibacter sp. TBRC 10068]MDI2113662.1 Fe2+-dependent dioxygenase [Commensalibacter sp. TBRC 10068]